MKDDKGESGNGYITRDEFQGAFRSIERKFDDFAKTVTNELKDVRTQSQPNMSTMAVWATVVIMIIGLIGTPLAFYINQRFDSLQKDTHDRLVRVEDNQDKDREDKMRRFDDWQLEILKEVQHKQQTQGKE